MSIDTITAPNGQRPAAPPATPRPAGKPRKARKNAKAVQVEARHAAAVLAVLHGEGTEPPEAVKLTIKAMQAVFDEPDMDRLAQSFRKGAPSLSAAVEMGPDELRAAMVGTGW
ncbi:MAG: hypothetical protein R2754_00130 [Microthrixaceae bacterium]